MHLARSSCLVVSEDMPVPPEVVWTQALAQQLAHGVGGGKGEGRGVEVWLVDTACVVPMRLSAKAFERAPGFRSSTAGEEGRKGGRGRDGGPGGWRGAGGRVGLNSPESEA